MLSLSTECEWASSAPLSVRVEAFFICLSDYDLFNLESSTFNLNILQPYNSTPYLTGTGVYKCITED